MEDLRIPGQTVPITLRPVLEFQTIDLPGPDADRVTVNEFDRNLTALSKAGYVVQAWLTTRVVLAKMVASEQILADAGSMVIPILSGPRPARRN